MSYDLEFTASVTWSDHLNGRPIKDLRNWQSKAANEAKHWPIIVRMNKKTFLDLIKHPEIIYFLDHNITTDRFMTLLFGRKDDQQLDLSRSQYGDVVLETIPTEKDPTPYTVYGRGFI